MRVAKWVKSPVARVKPIVVEYDSPEDIGHARPGMRSRGLYLSSFAKVPGRGYRAVWVPTPQHELREL